MPKFRVRFRRIHPWFGRPSTEDRSVTLMAPNKATAIRRAKAEFIRRIRDGTGGHFVPRSQAAAEREAKKFFPKQSGFKIFVKRVK